MLTDHLLGQPDTNYMVDKNAVEMFNELVSLGYVTPAEIDPDGIFEPAGYVGVTTTLAFETPPVPLSAPLQGPENAKLESRSKRDKKTKRSSR